MDHVKNDKINHIFKVAILQRNALVCDYQGNIDCIIEQMHKSANLNADILLLPECFITGYQLPIENEQALDDHSPFLQTLCQTAKTLRMGVVATAFTKGNQKPQNSAFIIDKNGEILLKYSKVHTCDFSYESCLESGDEFRVCDYHGVLIGIMICYDREYPESARILMMKGAELILVPNDCGTMKPRLNALSTRAYENMVGIAMANPPGVNAGNSSAFSPICWDEDGTSIENTMLLADDISTGLHIVEFDLIKLRAYRSSEMMGNTFRKVKAYAQLMNGEIDMPFIR